MADLQYTVGINTNPASAALSSLQSKVSGLTNSFGKLQGAVAGLAVGAAVANAIKYADAINDIKEATGIAIQNIAGFSKAVQLNGGDAEKAQAGILKLVAAIDAAASGSASAQDAFGQVGVTLNDLRTLSEQDIFAKSIQGLANIQDVSRRAALTTELLGKAFRSVNIQGVAGSLGSATSASAAYASSIQKAADLQDKLDLSMDKFRMSVLKAIEPLADFVSKLDQDQIDKFIDAVVKIGGAAVSLVAVGKALQWVAAGATLVASAFALFKTGLFTVTAGFATFTTGLASLGVTLNRLWLQLTKYAPRAWFAAWKAGTPILAELATTLSVLGTRLGFFVAGSAAAGGGLALMGVGLAKMIPFVGWLITGITALDWIIEKAFDWSPIDAFTNSVGNAYEAFKKFLGLKSDKPEIAAPKLPDTGAGAGRGGNTTQTADLIAHGEALAEQARKAREVADAFAKQRLEIRKLSTDFAKQNADNIDAINIQNMMIGKSKDYADVLTAQEELLKRTADKILELKDAKSKLSDEEKRAGIGDEYDKQITKVQELSEKEMARIKSAIENQNRLYSVEQLRLYGIQQEIDLQNKIQSVQDDIAKSTMTTIEKKYYDIEAAAKASAKAAIEAEEARIGRKLSTDEVKAYYDAAMKGAAELKKVTDEEYNNSRDFVTGWKQAFNEYAENASNAAQRAKDIFSNATKGMEDLIVNFAKTGKFEWKSFVNDMLVTLLRSQLQQTISSVFSGIGSAVKSGGKTGGGLFGGSIIPGFLASGGPASSNRSYIVGERGSELFTPASNGTVSPAGSFGGGSNVTYNISAVDARSFQAMIAQDPSFIHAVAMAGARNTPRR